MTNNSHQSLYVLGVYLGHDLGACLLKNGEISVCIEEERLNRFKHGRPNDVAGLWPRFAGKFGYFPWASVCYCLDAEGLTIDDVNLIVVGDALWAAAAEDTIRSVIPVKDKRKIVFVNEPRGAVHHYHHALSAFMASDFQEAAVLVVDGDGNSNENGYEAETGYAFENRQGKNRLVFKNRYKDKKIPRSGIGWTYEQVTLLLGFASAKIFLADPGKTMGLAPYGKPRPEFENPWITADGFKLDFSGFHNWLKETSFDTRVLAYSDGIATRAGGPSQYAMDLSYKVQAELESAMLHLAKEMRRQTRSKNLCIAGGVALNSVANGLIAKKAGFERIFIPPAAHDGGQAIGLAYHGHLMLTTECPSMTAEVAASLSNGFRKQGVCEIKPMRHGYGGRTYSNEEIHELIIASGLPYVESRDQSALVNAAAEDLAQRKIVGWFNGGSEMGPRALGHRSILANPDRPEMKDQLNSRVKFREGFRPFAPSVLAEKASEVFDLEAESPYMLQVVDVRDEWKDRIPAITHVDGTARVQTVNQKIEPLYHALISAFHARTGIPLILNTSFNLRSMPIVESPRDALQCFLYTDMDVLYLGNFKLEYPQADYLFPAKTSEWEFVESRDMKSGAMKLLCRSQELGRQFEIDATPQLVALVSALDGSLSLQMACDQAAQQGVAGKGSLTSRDALGAVQHLVREGAMQLKTGRMTFASPALGKHWWQQPSTKAAAAG